MPLLDAFDCPDPSVKMPRRSTTTTPLKALALMNNSFVLRQAKHFAERVRASAGAGSGAGGGGVPAGVGTRAGGGEAARALRVVREHGLESLCWALLNASEFLYVK